MEAAIAALLTEKSHADAAARAGVGESTLHRWLELSEFQDTYQAARQRVVEGAVGHLLQNLQAASEALVRNLNCGHKPSEIKAAVAMFNQCMRGLEVVSLMEEVGRLREQIKGKGGSDDDIDPATGGGETPPGGEQQDRDSADAAGGDPQGPGGADDAGGAATRPVAGQPVAGRGFQNLAAVFQTGGQEHGGGRAGAG